MSKDDRLNPFIGRWITQGQTADGVPIVASDVYEWAPGGKFVMHPAYGRIGDQEAGGLEVITPDTETGHYRTHFFDSQGSLTNQRLSLRDRAWFWEGDRTRCRGVFSEDGRKLTAYHERPDDDGQWVPSMTVTLRKI